MASIDRRQGLVVGLPWYDRADYERIREIMVDGQNLPASFDDWQAKAQRLEAEQRRVGRTTVRAHIDPEQFVAWCAGDNRQVDAKARIAWANIVALRSVRGEQ